MSKLVPQIENIADDVPWADAITPYDEAHFVTYLRLLDASAAGVSDAEMCRVVLKIDPANEDPARCFRAQEPPRAGALDDNARVTQVVPGKLVLGLQFSADNWLSTAGNVCEAARGTTVVTQRL